MPQAKGCRFPRGQFTTAGTVSRTSENVPSRDKWTQRSPDPLLAASRQSQAVSEIPDVRPGGLGMFVKRQARTWKSPRMTRAVPGLTTEGTGSGQAVGRGEFHLVWARIHRFLQPGATGRPGKVARLERILPQRVHVLGDRDASRKQQWACHHGQGSPTNSAGERTTHVTALRHAMSWAGVSEERTSVPHTTGLGVSQLRAQIPRNQKSSRKTAPRASAPRA